jgi:hypothetical protein
LRGYSVQILSGPNAGLIKTIASNTIGANAVITFTAAEVTPFSASTVYRLLTPVFFVISAGTLAAASFRRYDFATNTWNNLSITGLPATWGTDGRMVGTPSWVDTYFVSFSTGPVTAATGITLTSGAKTWAVNQWANSQVRIVSGLGAGQIRPITSNTATALTVPAWTTNPDATSTFSIEGNDDFLYLLGNNAVTMYRYQISTNTWSTLAPGVARAAAPGLGASGHWIWSQPETDWNNESAILNGRYIYSFQGGAVVAGPLHRYDIAANAWSTVTYAPATETFTTGTKWAYSGGNLYIQKDATGRWFRFNPATSELDGWATMLYPNGAAVLGDTSFDVVYIDGATKIYYIYVILNTSTVMLRQLVI